MCCNVHIQSAVHKFLSVLCTRLKPFEMQCAYEISLNFYLRSQIFSKQPGLTCQIQANPIISSENVHFQKHDPAETKLCCKLGYETECG